FYDNAGNVTTDGSITGLPAITAVPKGTSGAQQVYVDSAFHKVFDQYGPNLVTNGDFSQLVPTNGTGGGWTTYNNTGDAGWRYWDGSPMIVCPYYCYWNPGFQLDGVGERNVDPTIQQTLTGLNVGVTYQVTGSFAPTAGSPSCCGNGNVPAFAV